MIQDIAPSKLINSFASFELRESDSLFFFDDSGKALVGGTEGTMEIPRGSDAPAQKAVYLFSIDDTRYFLADGCTDFSKEGFRYLSIREIRDAFEGGWSSVKLYFMSGLPTETTEDLDGIADLARKVIAEYFNVPKTQRAKGLRVTVSVSVFVPKPFTPFQWAAQDTLETIIAKQEHLRQVLNIKGVTFHWHEPYVSFLEACFARGDRRMGRVLKSAFEKGCILDGWNETFRYDLWMEAFRDCGLDPAFYAHRARTKEEILPWDHIDSGVTKQFLWHEKEKSERAETTKDCRKGCNGCGLQRWKGVCSYANAGSV